MTLGLIDILKIAGFDPTLSTKLVRHQDRRYPVEDLRRHDELEIYQSYQGKPKFHGAEQIVSFYGSPGTRAGFYGVYKVIGRHSASEGRTLNSSDLSQKWSEGSQFLYDLKRDPRFDDFRDRLIIDWGPGALAWVQKLDNKPVLEILPPGRKLDPFDDYLEFSLTYVQLKDLFANDKAHRDWRIPLGAVTGVYLILAQNWGNSTLAALTVRAGSGVVGQNMLTPATEVMSGFESC